MRILLDERESYLYLLAKEREKTLEESTRFPADMKLPEGCKPRLLKLSKDQRDEIIRMYEAKASRAEISKKIGATRRQVHGVIQSHRYPIKDNIQASVDREANERLGPKVEGLQPMQPLVMPEVEKPVIEPTCASCGKPMGHDKVAIGGKFYCGPCAPRKVPAMQTKRIKPIKSNSAIDGLIVDMASKPPIDIADEINRRFGGPWLPEDVTKKLTELRSHD